MTNRILLIKAFDLIKLGHLGGQPLHWFAAILMQQSLEGEHVAVERAFIA